MIYEMPKTYKGDMVQEGAQSIAFILVTPPSVLLLQTILQLLSVLTYHCLWVVISTL